MQPEKMELTSMDVAAQKRTELKKALGNAFPEVFVDGSIDFDQLKRVLGEWVEPEKERFGLNWAGKAECMKVVQQPSVAAIKPMPAQSLNFDQSENIFIEGDNLEVLKLLQKSYFGAIKMIYIDPPYNTGKEFIYPDNFSESIETYLSYSGQVNEDGKRFATNVESSGRYHTRWLNMIYPRLYLARNLLTEDGAIFISIDEHEIHNLISVCNMIFGEENHVGTISVINNMKGRNDKANIATAHEYMVVYAKSNFVSNGLPLTDEQISQYKNEDEAGYRYALRDLRKRGRPDRREDRPNMYFPVFFDQLTGKCAMERTQESDIEILPKRGDGSDGRWRWGRDRVSANLNILHPRYNRSKDRWDIDHRVYLDPTRQVDSGDEETDDDDQQFERTSKSKSFWWGGEISTDVANREFKKLFGEFNADYPKSPYLIERVIRMATRPDDIVLDFFAGYSTTAQAIANLASEQEAPRKFIMVQLPEPIAQDSPEFSAGFKTIADISFERIVRALKAVSKEELGVRKFRLTKSNFKIWDGHIDDFDASGEQLTLHVEHIDKQSTPQDILYELLLKSGFPLSTQIAVLEIAGKQVFSVEDGAMLICLETEITAELIDAIAESNPLQVICLDAGFQGNDQLKANAVQTFRARAQAEESEIVFRTV